MFFEKVQGEKYVYLVASVCVRLSFQNLVFVALF